MFMYFVQRKRWLNGDPEFMRTFWDAYRKNRQPRDTFVARWLNIMFFEAFNDKFHGGHRHFPDAIRSALQQAPFLNGGLFSENELDKKFAGRFVLDDDHFRQTLTFLERYNFTVTEDTPLDQEVAVDAEMLGKVYESLVNVSEEADERGDAGIFYTPRTEIDMMCRLALVDYLANHLGEEQKSLLYEAVFAYWIEEKADADAKLSQLDFWNRLDGLIQGITVVDPACGSGSFLVGMLQVLDDLVQRADEVLGRQETPYERRKRIIGQSLYGVDVMRWAVEVAELRLWLQLVIETELAPAELKFRPLLPNLTFKIRRGDSLVQQVGGINMAHRKGSQAIPQALKGRITRLKGEKLKYFSNDKSSKFRSASEIAADECALFKDIMEARVHDLSNRLKSKRRELQGKSVDLLGNEFDGMDRAGRRKAEAEAARLQSELDQTSDALNALKRTRDVPFVWDIAFVEIFDGEQLGFDIVIGNPPYVRKENISNPLSAREVEDPEDKRDYKESLQQSTHLTWPDYFGRSLDKPDHKISAHSDLYIYFFFHGFSLLNEKGSFCFITSNSWLDVGYGKDLQEFLLTQGQVKMIIDNQAKRSFASADVNTAISLLGPIGNNSEAPVARFVMFKVPFEQVLSPVIFEEIESAAERKTTPEYRLFPILQEELFEQGCEFQQESEEKVERRKEGRSKNSATAGPLIEATRYVGNKWGGKYLRAPDIYWVLLEKLSDAGAYLLGRYCDVEGYIHDNNTGSRFQSVHFVKSVKHLRRIRVDRQTEGVVRYGVNDRGNSRVIAPIWFPRTFGSRHLVPWNAGRIYGKEFYKILPHDSAHIIPIVAQLNSTIGILQRELIGLVNLGDGALKFSADDVRLFYILLGFSDNYIVPIFETFAANPISDLPQDLKNSSRIALDDCIFNAIKLTKSERKAVYESVSDLIEARLNKAASLKTKERKKRGRAAADTLGIWEKVPDEDAGD